MGTEDTLELRWILSVIRRWWSLILGCALLALIVALFVTSRITPVYEATTTLLVTPSQQATVSEYNTIMASERLALTYSQLLEARSTLQGAISRLGLSETPETLAKRVETRPVKDTQLIRVTVKDESPARAVLIADTIAEVFSDYTKSLEQERYQGELVEKAAGVDAQRKAIDDTQSQIDAATQTSSSNEIELAHVQTLLANYRNTLSALQQEAQSLQLSLTGGANEATGAGTPQAPEGNARDRLANLQAEIASLSALIDQTQVEVQSRTAAKLTTQSEMARLGDLLIRQQSELRALQQDYDQLRRTANDARGTVVITDRAHQPQQPAQNRMLYVLLAVALAILMTFSVAFVIEYLDDSVKTREDVRQALGLTMLGEIDELGEEEARRVVAVQPQSAAAEAFSILATNIRLLSLDSHPSTILVTSPSTGEGKSVVAANLAVAMVGAGVRVVLVDADLRQPRLHDLFGLDQMHGLTDALLRADSHGFLKATPVEGVRILTSGRTPEDAVGLVSSPRMKKILSDLTQQTDLVVIDSPPILSVADAAILASYVDGVLMVVRSGQTATRSARHGLETLRQTRAEVLGVVLNGVPLHDHGYHRYGRRRAERAGSLSLLRRAPGLLSRRLGRGRGQPPALPAGEPHPLHSQRS